MYEQFRYFEKIAPKDSVHLIRVPAVDALTLSQAEIKAHYDREHYSFNAHYFPNVVPSGRMTDGEIACFLSHRKCWQKIIESDKQYAVVLEDDIIFSQDADAFLSNTAWIPQDADIVKLEVLTRKLITDIIPTKVLRDRSVVRFYSSNLGTAAYVISRYAAEKLLHMTENFYVPIDHFMFGNLFPYFKKFVCYQVMPAICIQDSVLRGKDCVFRSTVNDNKERGSPR